MGKTCVHGIVFERSFLVLIFCFAILQMFHNLNILCVYNYRYIAFLMMSTINKDASYLELHFSNFVVSGPLYTYIENPGELLYMCITSIDIYCIRN